MSQQHPITPPPELVQQWAGMRPKNDAVEQNWIEIATQAARWGSDQELEACCAAMNDWGNIHHSCGLDLSNFLRKYRRPKPPSLKEQALAVVENSAICDHLSSEHAAILRRALGQIPDQPASRRD